MPNSDDEGDSCVLVGTPLVDLIPEDAKFSVKAKRQEEQIVTDEKGRQRFHGAFTGGFSAGYFNSVGTKEGWAPSTFKSTRSEKNEKKVIQRPEDFMDDEDFSEHGIAPKTLKVKENYKDQVKSAPLSSKNYLANTIDSLIQPVRNTIGVKMARKMGWREGQGIGPRIKRKLRKLKTKIYHEPGRKIYGVTLPAESDGDDDDEIDDDEYLVSQFDVNEFQFEIKEDLFGLGYKRLDVQDLFSGAKSSSTASASGVSESPAASLLFPMLDQKNSKPSSIRGQAFSGGDFDDDDDYDVYKQDSIESYNFDLDGKNQKETKKLLEKTYGFGAFENDAMILKKFKLSSKKLEPVKVFKGPQVPPGFNLKHKLVDSNKTDSMNTYLKTASERAEVLNEPSLKPDSIFDLISQEDKNFLDKVKVKHGIIKSDNPPKEPELKQKLNEEEKAKRYEKFISFMKQNLKEPYSLLDTSSLTEWEKEREKEEFFGKYQQQAKQIEQAKLINSKFVSTKVLTEQNEEIEISKPNEEETAKKDEEKEYIDSKLINVHRAAREKKFGKQTRTEYEWRPHPTVCKRYNVPNPHPISAQDQTYGTVGKESSKKSSGEKFSMLEVLAASTRFETKTKNLFDELNADAASVNLIGPSHAKIVQDKMQPSAKIETEFETSKNIKPTTSEKKSEYAIINEKTPIIINKAETSETKEATINNIYLQERPEEIDMFKAIFENEDEEQEQEQENHKKLSEEENESDKEISQSIPEVKTSIVSSSLNKINLTDVKKYLQPNDVEDLIEDKKEENIEENKRVIFRKPGSKVETKKSPSNSSELELFSKLVKNLAKETKASSSSSSSDSDSDSIEEMVYEEVSISKKDTSSSHSKKHKKKTKKKKKKKHHKKK